jgi:alkaline phosphatase
MILCTAFMAASLVGCGPAASSNDEPGSAIFIHPDGTSIAHWSAARLLHHGPDGNLHWDQLPEIGVYRGHLRNQITATSNGGATVHAYGIKVGTAAFGMDDGEPQKALSGKTMGLAAEARAAGLRVGLVNSGRITEPGTGAFIAAVPSRSQHAEIARQIVESGIDVILGGGEKYFLPAGEVGIHGEEGVRTDGSNLIELARNRGYVVIFTRDELRALPSSATRILGLFAAKHTFRDISEERLREQGLDVYESQAPTLAEMIETALQVLGRDEGRFCLVVEEEGTDNLGNSNNAYGTIEAVRRADEGIGVVREFIRRRPETLLVVAADSDAGGLSVISPSVSEGDWAEVILPSLTDQGAPLDGSEGTSSRPFISAPDRSGRTHPFAIGWSTQGDVYGSIVVRAEGLYADRLPANVDNTDIYRMMYLALFGRWLK